MKQVVKLALMLLCLFGQAQTENHKFDVIHHEKLLGTLEATKTTHGNTINYQSNTHIKYNLLLAISILYQYDVTYFNGVLNEAKAYIVVRGKDKTNVKTVKENTSYKFYSEDKVIKTINEQINHSIVQLIFEEPIGITKIYAEEHGEFHNIIKIGEHMYLKTAPNGSKSTYFYKHGILEKSDVDAGIIEFSIVKRN